MDRQALKREIIQMYNRSGSYIRYGDICDNGTTVTTQFLHPTCRKTIEVTEDAQEVKCVLVYNRTANAMQRHAIECKTIEDFIKAVA